MTGFLRTIRAPHGETLSLERLEAAVPAIFADTAHEDTSSRYVHIPTRDVLSTLMGEGFMPVEARVAKAKDSASAKHLVKFRHASDGAERRVGDTSLEVILRNSHDGTSSYEFFWGLFKLICKNGMVVSDGLTESIRVRHAGNREKVLDKVIEGAFTVINEGPKVLEAPRKWSTIPLELPEREAFANAALVARYGETEPGKVDAPFEARHLLETRRAADMSNDLWTVFNRVQENVTRGGPRATYRDDMNRRRTATIREVKSIDGDVKLNRALWRLADEMAKLKA